MRKNVNKSQNFESSLASLEKIVRELERGDLPLERSLELFEQGVKLSRECQERLNEAERRVEVLLRDGEGRPVLSGLPGADASGGDFDAPLAGDGFNDPEENEDDDESAF
ncbi:MAG: exodeoxyribonuclease VII small subunit [Pyrinomonadaceae bacterium]